MNRFIGQLLIGTLLFVAGVMVGSLYEETPPVREFEPRPDMVTLQDPETVTDAFLIACAIQEYDGAAWLASPTWVAALGGMESPCTAVAGPPITEEGIMGLQRQTDQTAFVEWIWFEADGTSVVAYFLLEQTEKIGWQIVGLTTSP